ncbi:OmpA family protein [Gaetbulibacter saemankumensis]|uniref:OmpA family protein n=1 Tax=Gaetbulibacter saemankumensis TaxID=311208 RepID=UPI00040D0CB6|nr:OmpA family protein [Gaetbulibacter saemankumensis]
MKKLITLFFAFVIVGLSSLNAQDANNPWLIGIGVNAVDSYPTNVGDSNFPGQSTWFDEYFNATDHWNILPFPSSVSVSRYLGSNFSAGIFGSVNKITKVGDASTYSGKSINDFSYYGVDGFFKYSFAQLINSESFEPFIKIGGGYSWIDKIGAGTVNGGLGFNWFFTNKKNIGLNVQSTYKHAFEDYLIPHFQHNVGITFKLGSKDTDKDGIKDKDDACPEVPGLPEFNGCPDSDGDGVQDSEDECPEVAGLPEFNGCPDTDGDGIADKDDRCPKVAGLKELNGCPDSDGDGIADIDDKCPNEKGTAANNGCPEVEVDNTQDLIDALAKTIFFEFDSAELTPENQITLNKIADLIEQNNKVYNLTIEGYADNVGAKSYNQTLSERRAQAVADYLTRTGVTPENVSTVGYGEENPVAANNTKEGRAQNRRSEVKIKVTSK